MSRPLTVVFCLPGREFSGRFLDAWNTLLGWCAQVGVKYVVSRDYDAVVYYARNKVLGGSLLNGKRQRPWNGTIDYDYMLWIDSDVVFTVDDFVTLLKHQVDMACGLYLMADGKRFAAVEHLDEGQLQSQGAFEFLTPAALEGRQGLVEVGYSGFGFTLLKRGVIERLDYPWFRPVYLEVGEVSEFTSEDVGFCMLARKAGIKVHVDPAVVVGHEKAIVLRPWGQGRDERKSG